MVEPAASVEVAVVGGGILGLAVARELQLTAGHPSVVVLEREHAVGAHQTGHNSGVIHAGLYYRPGSLKAQLCRRGADALYTYCEARGIPARRCGKLVIARTARELPALDELERRARLNGVPGLTRIEAPQIPEIEPAARGVAALHSPATGVVDFRAVAHSLAADVVEAGGSVLTDRAVKAIRMRPRKIVLQHAYGELEASFAVFCAGAWSDRLARRAGAHVDYRIVPFRGAYLRLRPDRSDLVRALVYPVPDPRLPFLGVHLTRHIDGTVTIGPTALPVLSRTAYRLIEVRPRDAAETLLWPGTWRMARRWWRTGASEVVDAMRPARLVRAAREYVPELQDRDVEPAQAAGIRAQALHRDGTLLDDFVFATSARALHVGNAPSPGATAALAIAQHIASIVRREL